MLDLSNVELQKSTRSPIRPETDSMRSWIIAAVVVSLIAAAAAWVVVWRREAQRVATPAEVKPAVESAPAPQRLGAAAEPIELPPLPDTDPLVRRMVAALSAHPTVTRWLTTDGLIRNFVVVVENIAHGPSPARHLPVLRPVGSFRTVAGEDDLRIDPRTYQRYNLIAAAVDSVDADGAARLYAQLKPRIEEAYAELGRGESFDVALEQAMAAMLRTPALDGNVSLVPKGIVFAFENPRIERLTPAQKQLARMGPQNVRTIQAKLRQIAGALGIAPERLQ
jgi:hypothetical protein